MSSEKPPTSTTSGGGANPARGCVAKCPAAAAADPCGKDAVSNVTKCCGSEILAEAKKGNGGKDPKIVFGTTKSGFDAETDTSSGTVTISDKVDKCRATELVYFELTNVAATPTFNKIDSDATSGDLSREAFTKAREKQEYENVKKVLAAIDKCKKKWGCGSHASGYDGFRPAKDFDDYYANYLIESHKDHYRNFWDANNKAAYDAKHPPTPSK